MLLYYWGGKKKDLKSFKPKLCVGEIVQESESQREIQFVYVSSREKVIFLM